MSDSRTEPDTGALVAGRYRLVDRVHERPDVVTWRATDEVLRRSVMVHRLSGPARRDGQRLMRARHPTLPTVFDRRDDGDDAELLVTEAVVGTSLTGWRPGPDESVRKLVRSLAEGLELLDRAGLTPVIDEDAAVCVSPGGRAIFTRVPADADAGTGDALGALRRVVGPAVEASADDELERLLAASTTPAALVAETRALPDRLVVAPASEVTAPPTRPAGDPTVANPVVSAQPDAGVARRAPGARRRAAAAILVVLGGLAALGATASVLLDAAQGRGRNAVEVAVAAVAADDPFGDGQEHDAELGLLRDGDVSTVWRTEAYREPDFGPAKAWVGLVLTAPDTTVVRGVRIITPEPGWAATVEVRDGDTVKATTDVVATASEVVATFDRDVAVGDDDRIHVRFTRTTPSGPPWRVEVAEVWLLAVGRS